MNIKTGIFRNRILVFAILFSAIWHIFWLSAFKIVAVQKEKKPVKFSSVAFLGQILDSSIVSVDVKPIQVCAQETRYLETMGPGDLLLFADDISRSADALPAPDALSAADDEEFIALTVSRIDTDKIEPAGDVL